MIDKNVRTDLVHGVSSSGERELTGDRNFHGRYGHLSDDNLLIATLAARRAAHDAPLNPYRLDADGHRWVEMRSNAYADRSREWMDLANEVDRRGPKQPIHDWDGDSRR